MLKNLNTSPPPAASPKREESSDTDETSAVQYAGRGGVPPSRTTKPLLAPLPRTSTTKASKGLPRRTCCRCLGYATLLLLTVGSVVIGYGVSELMKGERSLNVALKKNLGQMKTHHFAMRKELKRQKELHGKHNSMISALTDAKGTLSTQLAEQKDTFATNEQKLKETDAAIKKLKAKHEHMLAEKESTHKELVAKLDTHKELVAKLEARLKAHATKLEEHAQKETQWSSIKHQIFAAFGSGAETFGDYDGGERVNEVSQVKFHKGYEFIPDHDASCDVSDRLASVQDASHLHCADEHARHENTCGGIPLVPSHCLLPGAGTFRPPASPLTISAAPLRFGGERVERPLCTTSQSFRDGGAFHNDTWRTKTGCHIAPLNPQVWISSLSAARKGPGECTRTIFFMGDSHIRNLFTATIAGLRGQATFAEGHLRTRAEKAGALFTYRYAQKLKRDGDGHIFARDSVRVVSTEEWLSRAGRERGQHGYCDCSVEQCIIMHRIWAPLFSDQISWMKKLQLPTEPSYDLVIFSPGNAYEKDAELPGEYRGAWDALRETHTNTTFSIVHFPRGKQPEGRGEALNAWANQHARMSLFVQNLDWDVQAKYTWHFACGLATTDVHSDTVKAFAPCTDRTDTAIIRGCITLSPLFVDDGRYDG